MLLNIINFSQLERKIGQFYPKITKFCRIYFGNFTQLMTKCSLIQRKWTYAYSSAISDITNIFQFLAVLAQKYTISPKMNTVWLTSAWHYSLPICHTISYHCARFYTNKPTNIETTNIFRFLTIFSQNSTVLPKNSQLWRHSARHHLL